MSVEARRANWSTVDALIAASGMERLADYLEAAEVRCFLPRHSLHLAQPEGSSSLLAVAVELGSITAVQHLQFPVSLDLLEDIAGSLGRLTRKATTVSDRAEVLNGSTESGIERIEMAALASAGEAQVEVGEYNEETNGVVREGVGVWIDLRFGVESGELHLAYPITLTTLTHAVSELSASLEDAFWRSSQIEFRGQVFEIFPFINSTADAIRTEIALSRPESREALAQGWARARWTELLESLPSPALRHVALAPDEAVLDIAGDLLRAEDFEIGELTSRTEAEQLPPSSVSPVSDAPIAHPGPAPDAPTGHLSKRPHALPALLAAAMLLGALGAHPYGYFVALRWVVCLIAIGLAFALFDWKPADTDGTWEVGIALFIGIALLFNPMIPVELDRQTWKPLDVLAALAFLITALTGTRSAQTRDDPA